MSQKLIARTFEHRESPIASSNANTFMEEMGEDIVVMAQVHFYDRITETYRHVIHFYE